MTVEELKEALSQYDNDLELYLEDSEFGFTPINAAELFLNVKVCGTEYLLEKEEKKRILVLSE